MMKRRLFFLGLLGAIVVGLGIYWLKNPFWIAPSPSTSESSALSSPAPKAGSISTGSAGKSSSPSAKIVAFLAEEGANFNSTNIDSEAAEKRVQTMAAALSANDIDFLLAKALELDTRASDRILSAYLLISAKAPSWGALRELILAPLKGKPHPAPHSIEEARAMQEKAIRIMAIDGLFDQAVKDPAARDYFFRLVGEIRDPTLARYAQKKVKDLRSM